MATIIWTNGTAKAGYRGKEYEGAIDGTLTYLVTPSTPAGGRYTLLTIGDADPVEVCKGSIAVCKAKAEQLANGDADPACKSCEQEAGPVNGNGDCLPCASDKNPTPDETVLVGPVADLTEMETVQTELIEDEFGTFTRLQCEFMFPEPMPAANHATKAKKPVDEMTKTEKIRRSKEADAESVRVEKAKTVAERKAARQAKKAKPETQLEVPPQLANGTPASATEPVKGRVGAKKARKANKEKLPTADELRGMAPDVADEIDVSDPSPEEQEAAGEETEDSSVIEKPSEGEIQDRVNGLVWNHGIKPTPAEIYNAKLATSDLNPTRIAKAERYTKNRLRDERDNLPTPRARESAGMSRIIALSGAGPEIEVPGGSPQSVLAWAEAVRDWGEAKGDCITALALINLAGRFTDQDHATHVTSLIRRMFATELAAEGKRKAADTTETGSKATEGGENASKAKPGGGTGKPNGGGQGKRYDLFGFPVTAVLRWMGKHGWDKAKALKALKTLNCDAAEATVGIQVRAGAKGERGEPASLTKEQAKQLEDAAK